MLTPEAEQRLASFIQSYASVRRTEGRGSADPSFYRSLPYPTGLDKRWSRHWRQRAESFELLAHDILPRMEAGAPLTILDLGAGNGWLSNRLAALGHDVIAIDLQTNDFDGLGCAKFYDTSYLAVQAEFDRLPIADRSVDLVIFNASLHYTESLTGTLREALRVLKPSGSIAILDSPIYKFERSGKRMLAEQKFSIAPSDRIGFLTWSRIASVAQELGLIAKLTTSPMSLGSKFIRIAKFIYLRREPAAFGLVILRQQ